jgi:hypothetical protein
MLQRVCALKPEEEAEIARMQAQAANPSVWDSEVTAWAIKVCYVQG